MTEGATPLLDILGVVADFVSVGTTILLGLVVYRLSRRDEAGRIERILEADRQARQETFAHERELQRQIQFADLLEEANAIMTQFIHATRPEIRDEQGRQAVDSAVEGMIGHLGVLGMAIARDTRGDADLEDFMTEMTEWSVLRKLSVANGQHRQQLDQKRDMLNDLALAVQHAINQSREALVEDRTL